MFCENCGAPLDEGARFCENCGAPVEPVAPVAPAAPAPQEPEPGPAGKIYFPNPARYITHMGLQERMAMLTADDTDDFPENE